jgi:hypothetical protein
MEQACTERSLHKQTATVATGDILERGDWANSSRRCQDHNSTSYCTQAQLAR